MTKAVIDIREDKQTQTKRYDIMVFNDNAWFRVGKLYTDSPWVLAWLNKCMKEIPPEVTHG